MVEKQDLDSLTVREDFKLKAPLRQPSINPINKDYLIMAFWDLVTEVVVFGPPIIGTYYLFKYLS